jgi:hypothetical protein
MGAAKHIFPVEIRPAVHLSHAMLPFVSATNPSDVLHTWQLEEAMNGANFPSSHF